MKLIEIIQDAQDELATITPSGYKGEYCHGKLCDTLTNALRTAHTLYKLLQEAERSAVSVWNHNKVDQ